MTAGADFVPRVSLIEHDGRAGDHAALRVLDGARHGAGRDLRGGVGSERETGERASASPPQLPCGNHAVPPRIRQAYESTPRPAPSAWAQARTTLRVRGSALALLHAAAIDFRLLFNTPRGDSESTGFHSRLHCENKVRNAQQLRQDALLAPRVDALDDLIS